MTSGMYRRFVPAERRRRMAALLQRRGSVSIAELEEAFGISAMTARRDLAALEERGLVTRTWGGASTLAPVAHEASFADRVRRDPERKRRLADEAYKLVQPNETLLVDSSSTGWYFVERLLEEPLPCTVITNSLAIVDLAAEVPAQVQVVVIGGILRPLTRSTVGPAATKAIRGYYADRAIVSVYGVGTDGGLTDPDAYESEVKAAIVARAREPMLLVDASKFGTLAQNRIGAADEFSHAIVADVGRDATDMLVGAGVELHEA
ncbi:DeoR/GlpR family DNA-binding transcription regulator [Conexibacter woesei]|uniref:Transcriptional regulator, DeoR family n=1 Tax=Conexibacter woesei (strain DSM 14684 / CCUG 47730 / CIP 108061 / JCM 11494 / NBRC 100937 / ID131577) TaxID=469383 RepID=D3F605_CONWI|nr:DeoR/GlpR family DNA-binding transcription regulator [Conexibacter woesei]ADB48678.1 transcriptional regulator, DeoR family [Conexibacter woesei DSM 14684]